MKNFNNLKFTVLTENHEACGLECEHGLSIYIEYGNKKYLLDAGQSGVFARNAQKKGIDLSEVDAAFLSHAHYDHADGFAEFFRLNDRALVFAREEGKLQDCYSVKRKDIDPETRIEMPDKIILNGEHEKCFAFRYIGMSPDMLSEFAERFRWIGNAKEVVPGVWLIPHGTEGLHQIGKKTGMYRLLREKKTDKELAKNVEILVPDCFDHEQSLVMETESGLVVFNSCSHGGVANIVKEVRQAFPGKRIYAYVGGFHLKAPGVQDGMNCTEQEVEALGKDLLELGMEKIYTGHCTGVRGFEVLRSVMGEKLELLKTGMSIEWGL